MKASGLFLGALILAVVLARVSLPFNLVSRQFPDCQNPVPGLPNVLLIGDSTQIRYYPLVRKSLQREANVCRVAQLAPQRVHSLVYGGPLLLPVNAGTSADGVKHLDAWLGDVEWDVIHFNWGLHELGGSESTVESYRSNLSSLTGRLKSTGAVLMVATTTPVPASKAHFSGEVEAFNAAASGLASESDIIVDDLYAVVRPRQSELQYADDVHFNEEGTQVLAAEVVKSIRSALQQRQAGD